MADRPNTPRWKEDFPIQWERDNYVTRRELAKFLTLGSALLVGVNAIIAAVGRLRRPRRSRPRWIARASAIAPGSALLFRYPTAEDPCILLRDRQGRLAAYSQVCTHLSCAVLYEADGEQLFCPCHRGSFSCTDGLPTGGPPTRRLPRIRIVQRGDDVYAVKVEV